MKTYKTLTPNDTARLVFGLTKEGAEHLLKLCDGDIVVFMHDSGPVETLQKCLSKDPNARDPYFLAYRMGENPEPNYARGLYQLGANGLTGWPVECIVYAAGCWDPNDKDDGGARDELAEILRDHRANGADRPEIVVGDYEMIEKLARRHLKNLRRECRAMQEVAA